MTDVSDLVESVDEKTSCICYFGGDPAPQLPFALRASRMALNARRDQILRICWETNGSMNRDLLDEMLELSLRSGGCIKFDIKAMDENLHKALTGVSNRRTLENVSAAAERIDEREVPPLVIASTLLVPGYIDEDEVRAIAEFLVSLNPKIPYPLLAFHPQFHMSDMPFTPRSMAMRCLETARRAGLERVRVGNIHILTPG
jgi:pyruvate formate lyase activating enzyme